MPAMYRRPLGRDSAHRQALLRNLVTSLISHESISTTWAKAKEAQRVAEKLITLGKKGTDTGRIKAKEMMFEPEKHIGKVFGELAQRYASRPGGYTRVLLTEPLKNDAAKSAVLCLVDGPKDMRFNMTARTLLRQVEEGISMNEITAMNIRKVTRFRPNGAHALASAVSRLREEKNKIKQDDEERFEKRGERFQYTSEIPKSDPRYDSRRGPGRLVKRRIAEDDYVDLKQTRERTPDKFKGKGRAGKR